MKSNPERAAASGALVLVVEDEEPVRRFLRVGLGGAGYRLLEAATGAEALRLAEQHVPDVVLLDLGLPDMEGRLVASGLRRWTRAPILVISARTEEAEKVALLDMGADDYLTKPFGFDELLARMRAALRRVANLTGSPGEGVFRCGPLTLEHSARRVLVDGREVHLTPIEYRMLTVLAAHTGRIVTRKQLLLEVWGPHSTHETQYLRVYMTHLRRKLALPGGGSLFRTEAGIGYALECPGESA